MLKSENCTPFPGTTQTRPLWSAAIFKVSVSCNWIWALIEIHTNLFKFQEKKFERHYMYMIYPRFFVFVLFLRNLNNDRKSEPHLKIIFVNKEAKF